MLRVLRDAWILSQILPDLSAQKQHDLRAATNERSNFSVLH